MSQGSGEGCKSDNSIFMSQSDIAKEVGFSSAINGIKFTATNPSDIPDPVNPAVETLKAERLATEAKDKLDAEERAKHIFHCFDGKDYPKYEDFNPYDPEEKALGYGGAAKKLGFKVALVAEWIVENECFKTDMSTGILYFFNGKKWVMNAEPYLEHLCGLLLGQYYKKSHYVNIEFLVKEKTYEKIEFSKKVACENGILDLYTLELTPFSPSEMTFHSFPVIYNRDVSKDKLANWLDFLKQVVAAEDIPILQEWFGYCLYPDFPKHKSLWVYGRTGRNGKGVYGRTIEGVIGKDNCSFVGLERLDGTQRFVLKDFYGKLYNSSSEPISNKTFQTEIYQKLTGGDEISAEFKGVNQEKTFSSYAKLTIYGNKFPRVKDPTPAFKKRMLFVEFPNEFNDDEQVTHLENVWLNDPEQKNAIFNWALEGLHRLFATDFKFSQTKSQNEIETQFLRTTDSVTAFIKETSTFGKQYIITVSEAEAAYDAYCDYWGLSPEKKTVFNAKLRDTPHITYGRPRILGKQERAWLGVTFKTLTLPENEANEPDEKELKENQKTLDSTAKSSQPVTNVTNVTGLLTPTNIQENKNLKEYKTPVTTVTPNGSKTIFFQRLGPHDIHHCDGLGHEAIEAEFVCFDSEGKPSGYWCKTHLFKIGKDCSSNGFSLLEKEAV